MRERVMKALHQTDTSIETRDSIDIGLCVFDNERHTLQYAGANRPLLMVRQCKLTEYKPDKMTIGISPVAEKPFTNNLVEVRPGDSFYLFSDGFSDQFGGTADTKFKYKNFRKIIESACGVPMEGQKDYLWSAFREWKGKSQQVDDVLIFGFQV
jgi:serine phosphatase RsbU (regulator of sigma subunit)